MAALVDTNVLVYRFDRRYPRQQRIATTEEVIRTAIRGWATYQLGWFDAHLWAYAETYGLTELRSEDFQHERFYGSVRAINPFR